MKGAAAQQCEHGHITYDDAVQIAQMIDRNANLLSAELMDAWCINAQLKLEELMANARVIRLNAVYDDKREAL